MAADSGKRDRATIMATIQVVFGIAIFCSALVISDQSKGTALFIVGFITVLLGIVTRILFYSKAS